MAIAIRATLDEVDRAEAGNPVWPQAEHTPLTILTPPTRAHGSFITIKTILSPRSGSHWTPTRSERKPRITSNNGSRPSLGGVRKCAVFKRRSMGTLPRAKTGRSGKNAGFESVSRSCSGCNCGSCKLRWLRTCSICVTATARARDGKRRCENMVGTTDQGLVV